MSTAVYQTYADHLQHAPYKIMSPQHAGKNLSADFIKAFMDPLYEPEQVHTPTRSTATIARMITLLDDKINFTIIDDMDVLEILEFIDNYFIEIRELLSDPTINGFVNRLLNLRKELTKAATRLLNKNPELKKQYLGLDSGFMGVVMDLAKARGQNVDRVISNRDVLDLTIHANKEINMMDNTPLPDRLNALNADRPSTELKRTDWI